jgi:hypothetical protein
MGGGGARKILPFRYILRRRRNRSSTEPMKTDNSISSLTTTGLSFWSDADVT